MVRHPVILNHSYTDIKCILLQKQLNQQDLLQFFNTFVGLFWCLLWWGLKQSVEVLLSHVTPCHVNPATLHFVSLLPPCIVSNHNISACMSTTGYSIVTCVILLGRLRLLEICCCLMHNYSYTCTCDIVHILKIENGVIILKY